MLSIFVVLFAFTSLENKIESAQIKDYKVIGGVDANIEDVPWQVAIAYEGYQICGGSIIDANRILTAAHCVDNQDVNMLSVIVGASKVRSYGQAVKISRYHVHKGYIDLSNDIAVIILKSPLKFDKKVQPVKLPTDDKDLEDGTDVMVSGWGVTYLKKYERSQQLQKATVKIINRKKCNELMAKAMKRHEVDSGMICAGIPNMGGIDACYGDSGGPLITTKNKVLHGIVSWGIGCAEPNLPGVYVKVAAYLSWISEQN